MHFIYMYTVYVQWDTFQVSQMYANDAIFCSLLLYFVWNSQLLHGVIYWNQGQSSLGIDELHLLYLTSLENLA